MANDKGALQGAGQGAAAGAQAGGGWGALIGGILGAAGGSQIPEGKLQAPQNLQGYGTPGAISSEYGGSYVDPITGRVVYTSPGQFDASQYMQNAQYNSMLNQLLGIQGGGGMDSFALDQQLSDLNAQLADIDKNASKIDAGKYINKNFVGELLDSEGKMKSLGDLYGQGQFWNAKENRSMTPEEIAAFRANGKAGLLGSMGGTKDTWSPLYREFMAQTNGNYGKGDAWKNWLNDVMSRQIDPAYKTYEKALDVDRGNAAVREEQKRALQSKINSLNYAKQAMGQAGGQAGQGGAGGSLLGYLTNAPNIQRMEIQKNLADAQSLAQQRANRMGMGFSSQNELAQGANAVNSAMAMNNASRQNWQDQMSLMDWLRGGQAQAANQKAQQAQTQLGFTGQGYGVGTHIADMEAQRQAAQAGMNTAYTMGQANLDSARQQAMMQGIGGIGQAVGSYYGSQSRPGHNPQFVGSGQGGSGSTATPYGDYKG